MRKVISILLPAVFFMAAHCVSAQNQAELSLQQALQTGLQNNYDVRIYKDQGDIAHTNNTLGNAGALPSVETDATYTKSIQSVDQTFANGAPEIRKSGASTTNLSAGIELDWTIFQGWRMHATKKALDNLDKVGMLNFRNQLEQTALNIINAYYAIVLQQQQVKVFQESIRISAIKLDIAKSKFEIGSASKLDYLQAKVDMNADSTNLLHSMAELAKAKEDLNNLMAVKERPAYKVADTIILMPPLPYADLQNQLNSNNVPILIAQQTQNVYDAYLQQSKSGIYPRLSASSRYAYGNQKAQAGFILENQTTGLSYWGSAYWTLFNGNIIHTQIQDAKITYDISRLAYDQVVQNQNTLLQKYFEDYTGNSNIVKVVTDNQAFAQENLDIANERYRIGKGSYIDYRTAQVTYINSRMSLVSAIYNTKVSEMQLMKLSGQINKVAQ